MLVWRPWVSRGGRRPPLGVLARELLEGCHPLGDIRGKAAMHAILDGVVAKFRDRTDDLPEDLQDLLQDMLAADPGPRPSARQVAARLQALQVRRALLEY